MKKGHIEFIDNDSIICAIRLQITIDDQNGTRKITLRSLSGEP